jgi:hypothetical protein
MTAESATSRLVGKLKYCPKPDCVGAEGIRITDLISAQSAPNSKTEVKVDRLKPHAAAQFYVDQFR